MFRLQGALLVVAASIVFASLTAADDKKSDAAKEELKKLEGTWQLVSAEQDGEKMPQEQVKKMKLVVKGDKVTVYADDKAVSERTFKVDPSKKPKELDSTPTEGDEKGKAYAAIYEFDGDAGKLCQAAPGKDRPKEFDAKKGTGNMLAVYKRAKP